MLDRACARPLLRRFDRDIVELVSPTCGVSVPLARNCCKIFRGDEVLGFANPAGLR